MTTMHAYTATEAIIDRPNKKPRRGRAAAANLICSSTGAAIATTTALPQYAGKFDGLAVRVPLAIGSLADLVFLTSRRTTVEEVNSVFAEEANSDRSRGMLGVTDEPLVSSAILQDPRASIVDPDLTQVGDGDLVKVTSRYDMGIYVSDDQGSRQNLQGLKTDHRTPLMADVASVRHRQVLIHSVPPFRLELMVRACSTICAMRWTAPSPRGLS